PGTATGALLRCAALRLTQPEGNELRRSLSIDKETDGVEPLLFRHFNILHDVIRSGDESRGRAKDDVATHDAPASGFAVRNHIYYNDAFCPLCCLWALVQWRKREPKNDALSSRFIAPHGQRSADRRNEPSALEVLATSHGTRNEHREDR